MIMICRFFFVSSFFVPETKWKYWHSWNWKIYHWIRWLMWFYLLCWMLLWILLSFFLSFIWFYIYFSFWIVLLISLIPAFLLLSSMLFANKTPTNVTNARQATEFQPKMTKDAKNKRFDGDEIIRFERKRIRKRMNERMNEWNGTKWWSIILIRNIETNNYKLK